ncbi:hypothetical protein ABPG77_007647 [Micractinium sp. CCAP 211/92]
MIAQAVLPAFCPLQACLPLRLDKPEQLRCPLLSSLRCSQLSLPLMPRSLSDMPSWDGLDASSLFCGAAFRHRSGSCLTALLRVPADKLGCSILECCSRFPALRRISLADAPGAVGGELLLDVRLPSSLHTLELPTALYWSARTLGWQPPSSLQRLVQRSTHDLTIGHTTLCPCAEHVAWAGRTSTVHTSALQSAVGCRRLEVSAKWVVLSSHEPGHVGALLETPWTAPLQPLHLDTVLEAWLGVLASAMGSSSIASLELTTRELSLYSQPCSRIARLPLPCWQQPGEQRVAAHGLEARLRWPVAGQGPACFALTVTKQIAA